MLIELDAIDRKILTILQQDCSLSTGEVADRVGISQAPCWRRIRRMEELGLIRMRVALLDRRKLGLNVMIFASIKLAAHGRNTLPQFEQSIRRYPEVLDCYTLLGETDFLLRIVTSDVESYERFFRDKLSQLPAVRETTSAIVLSEIKNTTALPLTMLP